MSEQEFRNSTQDDFKAELANKSKVDPQDVVITTIIEVNSGSARRLSDDGEHDGETTLEVKFAIKVEDQSMVATMAQTLTNVELSIPGLSISPVANVTQPAVLSQEAMEALLAQDNLLLQLDNAKSDLELAESVLESASAELKIAQQGFDTAVQYYQTVSSALQAATTTAATTTAATTTAAAAATTIDQEYGETTAAATTGAAAAVDVGASNIKASRASNLVPRSWIGSMLATTILCLTMSMAIH